MAQGSLARASAAHVAIIGSGWAGLSAAALLAEAGIRTTLLETSKQPGGRARGLSWKGQRLDNGQHILLGAYSETLSLMRLAGINPDEAFLRLPLQLSVHGQFELNACSRLPAPLHVLVGLLQAPGLSFTERWTVIKFMGWMRWVNFKLTADEPLQDLLQRHRQSVRTIKLLWEPLCLAALNTPLAQASAQLFLHVLRDSFASAKSDSDMLLPRYDLSTLFADPVANYVQSRNGDLHFGVSVTHIDKSDDSFQLQTSDALLADFSHVIIAVSPFRAAELISHLPEVEGTTTLCVELGYQPIYTVYLQYASDLKLPKPMIGLAEGGHCQWLFDRGQISGQHGLIAVVISAEGPHQSLTQQELAVAAANELTQAFPAFAAPLWHKVIAEKRATFACTPGLVRPAQQTAIPGLYLAGDYTAGDYPATIEGAVRSGATCARHILRELAA